MEIKVKKKVIVTTEGSVSLAKGFLITLLKEAYIIPHGTEDKQITIKIKVPGGGDYSNCDLELDDDKHPLLVEWKIVKENEE